MKRLAFVPVLILALMMSACCSSAIEKKAVDDLKATQDLIHPEYIRLVKKEFASDPAKIENREKLVKSSEDIVQQMKANVSK